MMTQVVAKLATQRTRVPFKAAALSTAAMNRPVAVVSMPRADMTDPKAMFTELRAAFEAFKTENDAKLAAKAGKEDVVANEKVDRISATVIEIQAALDAQAAQIAAARLSGTSSERKVDDPDYTAKFSAFFRDGADEAGVKAVQRSGPRAAMSEGSSANGGYVTPVEWDRTITGRLKLISPIRQYAKVQAISTIGFSKVFNDRTVGSGWVGETASRPATTTPGLTSLAYAIGEIYANANATQDLLDDALINIEDWLASEIDTEFARQEGIAFISGDGTNKPTGLLTYVTGAANAAAHPFGDIKLVNSAAATTFTSDAILSLIYALPAMYQANAKFFGNRTSLSALMKLKNGQGNYLWQPSYQAGQPSTLVASPFIDLPDMPNVGAGNIPLLYGDMETTYLVIDRQGTRVLRDPYTNKPYVSFYTTKRVGGGLLNPDAMKGQLISA
jgi:HK97 family phage major capsid protein